MIPRKKLKSLLSFFLGIIPTYLNSFKIIGNGLIILSISNKSFLGFIEKLKSLLSFFLGIIPTYLNSFNIALKKFRFVWILKDSLALGNKICDNVSLGIKLRQRLFLSLNELLNILNTRWSNFSGG